MSISGRRFAAGRRGCRFSGRRFVRPARAKLRRAASQTCPECHGSGQVTQMGGRMKFNIQCPRCGGSGKTQNACPTCNGEGTVTRTEQIEFRIKPGTRDGQRIRLAGKGNAGVNGGPAGDLYLIIRAGTQSGIHAAGRRYSRNGSGDRGRGGAWDRRSRFLRSTDVRS